MYEDRKALLSVRNGSHLMAQHYSNGNLAAIWGTEVGNLKEWKSKLEIVNVFPNMFIKWRVHH